MNLRKYWDNMEVISSMYKITSAGLEENMFKGSIRLKVRFEFIVDLEKQFMLLEDENRFLIQ